MQEAVALARLAAAEGEVPVGAVVVFDGKVIARGRNAREHTQDLAAHAELIAMREAAQVLGSWRLTGCTVYVTLEPCPMCAGAIVQSRTSACVFGASDPKGGFFGTLADLSAFPGLNHQVTVRAGVEEETCAALLTDFFRGLRRASRRS